MMSSEQARLLKSQNYTIPVRGINNPIHRYIPIHSYKELNDVDGLQKIANANSRVTQLQEIQHIVNSCQSVMQKAGTLEELEEEPAQLAKNNTGLPDDLKQGMESTTGYSMDHVRVHYNSPKPLTLQAHAYAQGNEIHLASGQEKHLPHELGHVVQQMEGRVRPTMSVDGVGINDDAGLENEATLLGEKASR